MLCNKDDVPEGLKTRYGNFINYLQRLVQLSNKHNDFELSKLNREVEESVNTEFKGWLMEKLRELMVINRN